MDIFNKSFDKLLKQSRNSIKNKNFLDNVPKNINISNQLNNLKKELLKDKHKYGSYRYENSNKNEPKRQIKLISLGDKKTISKAGALTKIFGGIKVKPEKLDGKMLLPKLNRSKKLLFEKLREKLKEKKECPKGKILNPKSGRCIKQRKL